MITLIKDEKYLLADVNVTEANLGNADTFKNEVVGFLDRYKKSIVLNMAQITYVDSSFLGALVASLKHAIGLKLDIVLVGLQPDIHDLIKLIRLDKVLKIYDNYSEVQ